MKSSQLKWALVALPLCLALSASPALGQVFSADFDTPDACDLLQSPDWFGKSGLSAHTGFTIDILGPRGCVLSFTARVSGGDLFSKTFPIQSHHQCLVADPYRGHRNLPVLDLCRPPLLGDCRRTALGRVQR